MTEFFSTNEHWFERVVRVVIGVGLLSLIVVGPQSWLGLVGLVPLVTGVVGVCPLYSVFGFKTCTAC